MNVSCWVRLAILYKVEEVRRYRGGKSRPLQSVQDPTYASGKKCKRTCGIERLIGHLYDALLRYIVCSEGKSCRIED